MDRYFEKQDEELQSLIRNVYEMILSSNERLPEVQNVVVTFSLGVQIHPMRLAANGFDCDYKPGRFAAAITRTRPPAITALQFKTGRMVIVGAKSKTLARCAKQFCRKRVNEMGYKTKMTAMELHNKVCNVNVGYAIDVARIRQERRFQSTFEPETFPGLIYSHPVSEHRMVIVLLFDTGGAIMMGLRLDNEEFEVWNQISGILKEYRDDTISKDSHNRYVARLRKKINDELKKRSLTYTKVGSMKDARQVLLEMTNSAMRELVNEEIDISLDRICAGKGGTWLAQSAAKSMFKLGAQFRDLFRVALQDNVCVVLKDTDCYDVRYVTDVANREQIDAVISECLEMKNDELMEKARDAARTNIDETLWRYMQEALRESMEDCNEKELKEGRDTPKAKEIHARRIKKAEGVLIPSLSEGGLVGRVPLTIHINQIMILMSNFLRDHSFWSVDLMFYKKIESQLVNFLYTILCGKQGDDGSPDETRLRPFVNSIVTSAHPAASMEECRKYTENMLSLYTCFVKRYHQIMGEKNAKRRRRSAPPKKKKAVTDGSKKDEYNPVLTTIFQDALAKDKSAKLAARRLEDNPPSPKRAKYDDDDDDDDDDAKEAMRVAEVNDEEEERALKRRHALARKYGFKAEPRNRRAAILLEERPGKYRYDTAHL